MSAMKSLWIRCVYGSCTETASSPRDASRAADEIWLARGGVFVDGRPYCARHARRARIGAALHRLADRIGPKL